MDRSERAHGFLAGRVGVVEVYNRMMWTVAVVIVAAFAVTVALLTANVPSTQSGNQLGTQSATQAANRPASSYGNDISWPQCPAAQGGYGLPLPAASAQFVVIGLTKGLPFTENPCLTSQAGWAKDHQVPAQAYAMAAFPTPKQLSAYRSQGPWPASTKAGQLSNAGYAEAMAATASLKRVGFKPAMVWIDVEPHIVQPWPAKGTASQQENRSVLEGMMRGLHDAGYPYGVYSFTSSWRAITGSWQLPAVPVWATAGQTDQPADAAALCNKASFSGGPVKLAQRYDATRDYDIDC
ncbi:hypothetical protein [Arthrobacter sp. ERGS1:01]|uniref:hypothetical protein n=1 Tax=Arthrobacter sp. ERGS1:01 TaxID=1704044 RepID=UPI0006B69B25|nr:hypothetical protein [Arthrobacter sp. ERGS1:01]